MKYACIGFDVRVWPCDGVLGVGESEWSRHESAYKKLTTKFNLTENFYGILEIRNTELLVEICDYLKLFDDCTLVALGLPCGVAEVGFDIYGAPRGYDVDLSCFRSCGVDISDINGFFSVLSHPEIEKRRGGKMLIPDDDIEELLVMIQLASVLDRGHLPYIATKLWSIK